MKKCKCYHTQLRHNFSTGEEEQVGYCYGTKDCESCSCGGDESKCNFYEYIRERALAEQAKTPLVATVSTSPRIEVIGLNVDTLVKALLERSFKEKQTFPWWVFQEIYKWNKGE